ncbi:MAG: TetR family transcriptional regulator [Chloroflexi bacterium]|nr:TetR family transcriptional regulator [Chloroflexota bacterium]
MNRQQAKDTRQAFIDAFISLWAKQDYHSLTIRKVADESGHTIVTFYRHFETLDDLLMSVVQDLVAELLDRIQRQETRLAESVELFSVIRENLCLFRAYYALPSSHPAYQLLRDALTRFLEKRYEPRQFGSMPIEIVLEFCIGATLSVIGLYLDNIERFTAEQAAELYSEMILKALGSTALVLRQEWLQRRPHYLKEN